MTGKELDGAFKEFKSLIVVTEIKSLRVAKWELTSCWIPQEFKICYKCSRVTIYSLKEILIGNL